MRPQPVRVSIDLETTGLHPEQDAIIEIGAVKFAGERILDTFETLVAPGIALPYRIQRLTSITPAGLRGAPHLAAVLPRLRAFLGDLPLVGHNVPFDAAFLRRAALARRNPLVDTYEFASALLPGLPSYTLAAVGEALGIASATHHRALADAQLARAVLLALVARFEALDAGILEALDRLPAPPEWTLRQFLGAGLRAQRDAHLPPAGAFGGLLTSSLGEQLANKLEIDPAVLSMAVALGGNRGLSSPPHIAASASEFASEIPPQGAATLREALIPGMEACLRDGGALLVEAGVDDASLSICLEPALRWAAAQQGRVLVAIAEAERLPHVAREVVPQACAGAGVDPRTLRVAEIAERDAYLCLHRWLGDARPSRDGALPRETTRGLAKMILWARETTSGRRTEVALSGQETLAWELARAGDEFADSSPDCPYQRDGYCFVTRARDAAAAANVVVTTHAALAAHLAGADSMDSMDSMLPETTRVLVLDAPRFEEAVRGARSFALDRDELLGLLASLAATEAGGRRMGLLHLAAKRVERPGEQSRERGWFDQVARARQAAEAFFAALQALLAEHTGNSGGKHAQQADAPDHRILPLDLRARGLSAWEGVADAWVALDARLAAVARLAGEVAEAARAAGGAKKPLASSGIATDLLGLARRLERTRRQGTAALHGEADGGMVRWLRIPYPPFADSSPAGSRPRAPEPGPTPRARPGAPAPADGGPADGDATMPGSAAPAESPATHPQPAAAEGNTEGRAEPARVPALHGAPADIGSYLAPLYAPGRALVLIGAAMAVGGEFEHMRGTFSLPEHTRGIARARDRTGQTLLCLPEDVPEPNAPHYQRQLDATLIGLAQALGGRLVVLFPSHAALRAAHLGVRRALEQQDILVLGQGQDGSARQLWHTFNTQPRTVLLGTGAFWSGDERREHPPACVVVTRLPFPALSDPLVAARADMWEDPQGQFVVPQAALKLRQALNGLAWSHAERNAVLLFDRRIQTRGYGATILGTLPRCAQHTESAARLIERIAEWVGEP